MQPAKLVLLAALLSPSANAEPSEVSKFLMTDSVSMMDWGIYKLENILKGVSAWEGYKSRNWYVSYDYEKNIIRVRFYGAVYPADSSLEYNKELCKNEYNFIRGLLGYSKKNNKINEYINFSNYFTHEGFEKAGVPKDFANKLANITVVSIQIVQPIGNLAFIVGDEVKCGGPLLGKGIQFTESDAK